ncbi:MAG: SPOR domain-containing protein [Pseudomonadota bacterium]|nr:SPOR domain-containing protein [Pseudomonadota bacterium]
MIKVLPIILTPVFFLIIFFNVRNLTDQKDENINNLSSENVNIIDTNTDQIHKKKPIKIIENNKEVKNTVELKKTENEKNEKLQSSIKESGKDDPNNIVKEKQKKKELETQGKAEEEKKKKELEVQQNAEEEKKYRIQFGAFSKLKNAESQKKLISKKISIEFPEFKKDLRIIKEQKLFKLIFYPETQKYAESVCNFSKIKEINCLIIKK